MLLELIPDPSVRVLVADILLAAGVLVPLLRRVAQMTRTRVDDHVLDVVDKVLAFIPRAKIGR